MSTLNFSPDMFFKISPLVTDNHHSVKEKFADLRWVPLEPEFINYPNAQFLMIGEAQDELGKAAVAEVGGKEPHQQEPGEELEKFESENEERIETLKGTGRRRSILKGLHDMLTIISLQATTPYMRILAWMPGIIPKCPRLGTHSTSNPPVMYMKVQSRVYYM